MKLKISRKAVVYIDWANVYGWQSTLKRRVDTAKLYKKLESYRKVKSIKFFFGREPESKESEKFLDTIKSQGYELISKDVKHIVVKQIGDEVITMRKCDFDIEISMNVYEDLDKGFETFIFFSGDGDFLPIYEYLIKRGKQVIVVYQTGHLGKEISNIESGIYLVSAKDFGV